MKKISIGFFALLFFVFLSAGCSVDEEFEFSFNSSDPIDSYDTQSVYVPEDNSSESGDNGESNASAEGLMVKSKRYTFEGNDIIILNVTNQTKTNYIVTVQGTYLDKSGQIIKTEEQSFDQFSADYQNNFLFNPGIAFDDFSYEIQTTPTNEPMHVENLNIQFHKLFETEVPDFSLSAQGDHTFYPTIVAEFLYQCKKDIRLYVMGYWIVLNSKDEIVAIVDMGTDVDSALECQHEPLYFIKEGDLVWPENMTGEIRAVHAVCIVRPM